MATFMANPNKVARQWHVIDATGLTLGRLASAIALRLRGKHKPEYTPHVDTGDYIIVLNADKFKVTGKKMKDKVYYHHTGYPGGIKSSNLEDRLVKKPTWPLMKAVKGMLPKNRLGRTMLKKLRIFAGPEHTHQAQQTQPLEI